MRIYDYINKDLSGNVKDLTWGDLRNAIVLQQNNYTDILLRIVNRLPYNPCVATARERKRRLGLGIDNYCDENSINDPNFDSDPDLKLSFKYAIAKVISGFGPKCRRITEYKDPSEAVDFSKPEVKDLVNNYIDFLYLVSMIQRNRFICEPRNSDVYWIAAILKRNVGYTEEDLSKLPKDLINYSGEIRCMPIDDNSRIDFSGIINFVNLTESIPEPGSVIEEPMNINEAIDRITKYTSLDDIDKSTLFNFENLTPTTYKDIFENAFKSNTASPVIDESVNSLKRSREDSLPVIAESSTSRLGLTENPLKKPKLNIMEEVIRSKSNTPEGKGKEPYITKSIDLDIYMDRTIWSIKIDGMLFEIGFLFKLLYLLLIIIFTAYKLGYFYRLIINIRFIFSFIKYKWKKWL
jgi:hypothetical protein